LAAGAARSAAAARPGGGDMLNDQDRARIAHAVAEAEAATSGEIVCVLAQRVSNYREVSLAWGAAAALLLPPAAIAAGVDPLAFARWTGGWTAGHSGAAPATLTLALGAYAVVQAILFALVAGAASLPQLRRVLTPAFLRRRRVGEAAAAQLAAAALAAGPERAAVVIFACEADHIVDVRATEAVHAKAGQAVWDQAVAAMLAAMRQAAPADGFVQAIALCAAPMAEHFPARGPDDNAVADAPLEL